MGIIISHININHQKHIKFTTITPDYTLSPAYLLKTSDKKYPSR